MAWYFRHYYGAVEGPACLPFYCQPSLVGKFAVSPAALAAGEDEALFRVAVGLTMFQTRRDVDIMASQARMMEDEVAAITRPAFLLEGLRAVGCPHASDLISFKSGCDVHKLSSNHADCHTLPKQPCVVKEASRLMRRYGDFGKAPVALAWLAPTAGATEFSQLHGSACEQHVHPLDRAKWLETMLCKGWRINKKIANFILSALSNPDLAPGLTPWSEGVDWTHFVVVDRHVARALVDLGVPENASYEVFREQLFALARHIDLRAYHPGVHAYNPRLIQQALYRFRSTANRHASAEDCCHSGIEACLRCPATLNSRCSLRTS